MLELVESARDRNSTVFIGTGELPALSRNSFRNGGAAARVLDEFELLRDNKGRVVMAGPGD